MISMTGFAYTEKTGNEFSASLEIKGYNGRHLDIYINLPPFLSMLEMKIKDKVSAVCGRGKIEVSVRIREQNIPVTVNINSNAAKAYYTAITNLANDLNIEEKPRLHTILGMDGVLDIEKNRDENVYWNFLEPMITEALKTFCEDRQREGKHTEEDILKNLEIITAGVNIVSSFAPAIETSIKENIKLRFTEMLGNQVDENRVLAETAALLIKYTISEEISRLNSHLKEFISETKNNPRPGKKLDFLCQEINREINTIGSKATGCPGEGVKVCTEVVKMKEALENVREQLRNVE